MTYLQLRKQFLSAFLFHGKKYNSFFILNNIFYYLTLKNKNTLKNFVNFFLVIEPLFFMEKMVYMSRLTQYILYLPNSKKINTILHILQDANQKFKLNKLTNYSKILMKDIYDSLLKNGSSYNYYKIQNENYIKLQNNSNYRWF